MAQFFASLSRRKSNFELNQAAFNSKLESELELIKGGKVPTVDIPNFQIKAVQLVREHFQIPGKQSPAVIKVPVGADTVGIVAMVPYALGSKKVLILTQSKNKGRVGQAFGEDVNKPNFFELTSMTKTGRAEMIENYLEQVTVIVRTEQTNRRMGNLVLLCPGKSNAIFFPGNGALNPGIEGFFSEFCTVVVQDAHFWGAKTLNVIFDHFGPRGKKIILIASSCDQKGVPFMPNQTCLFAAENIGVMTESDRVGTKRTKTEVENKADNSRKSKIIKVTSKSK